MHDQTAHSSRHIVAADLQDQVHRDQLDDLSLMVGTHQYLLHQFYHVVHIVLSYLLQMQQESDHNYMPPSSRAVTDKYHD